MTNAYTTNDHTTFFIDCPARNAMTAIELTADAMQHITFEPKEFARELKVVRRELADDEVDRGHVMNDLLDLTVYAVHPARHPVIGYLQVLNGTTNQAIIDFYHERYVPNNQIFVVVGDVNTAGGAGPRGAAMGHAAGPGDVRRPARGAGAGLAAGDGPRDGRHGLRLRHRLAHRHALATRHVRPGSGGLHPRRGRKLAAGAAVEVREPAGPQRRRRQQHAALRPRLLRRLPPAASRRPGRRPSAEIVRQVYRLRDEEIGEAELAKAKKQKAAELVFQRQTVQQQAESLGLSYLATSDPLFDRTYTEKIQAVTAAEIRAAARNTSCPRA